ncbi:MAG: toxin-antitoxin system YwqK family antitoxin [Sulfurimonas sp.]
MTKFILIIGLFYTNYTLSASELLCKNYARHTIEDNAQKSIYKNCKRNGITLWFKDNGDIKSKVNFIDGKENGLYTSYYANGQKKIVVNYVDGQKDNIQKIYYDNGQLGSKINYVMGRREGVMTDWDIDGYKSAEVFYKNNYKVGLKKYYNHAGKVIRTETYKMDRNPVMVKLLKDKRKEILVDLSKYGLVPKEAALEDRIK